MDYRQIGIEAARKAGRVLKQYFTHASGVNFKDKAGRDLVSDADKASEQVIKETLPPEQNWLMEESGLSDHNSEYTWVVDPLDGTANFLRKIPLFSISIALIRNSEVLLAIVYNPILEELYIAEKGAGATLNGEKIRVSETKKISESCIVQSLDTNNEKRADNLKNLQKIFFDAQDIRILNACAISLSYVASGKIEAAIISGANPWDIAAGALLVEKAGGKVTTFDNFHWNYKIGRILASNGKIHEELVGYFNNEKKSHLKSDEKIALPKSKNPDSKLWGIHGDFYSRKWVAASCGVLDPFSLNKIEAIAFDLEGTVVDVESAHHQAHILSAQDVGVIISLEDCFTLLPHFIGGPDEKVAEEISELASRQGISADKEYIIQQKKIHYGELLKTLEIKPRSGFLEFFQAIKAMGLKYTIGSLTSSDQAKVLLERSGIGELFGSENIILREDVKKVKPAPDVWYATAKRAGVRPENQMVFEDSPRGIQGAVKVGAYCIGMPVYNRPDTVNALVQAGAKRVFMSWTDINPEKLIEEINEEHFWGK